MAARNLPPPKSLARLIPSGAAFDVLHLTLGQLLLILTAAALAEAVGWCAYAFLANRAEEREGGYGGGYLPVQQKDMDEVEAR